MKKYIATLVVGVLIISTASLLCNKTEEELKKELAQARSLIERGKINEITLSKLTAGDIDFYIGLNPQTAVVFAEKIIPHNITDLKYNVVATIINSAPQTAPIIAKAITKENILALDMNVIGNILRALPQKDLEIVTNKIADFFDNDDDFILKAPSDFFADMTRIGGQKSMRFPLLEVVRKDLENKKIELEAEAQKKLEKKGTWKNKLNNLLGKNGNSNK